MLTVILDDYSRAICGYMVFSGAPSAMNTALALRQAIWPKPDPSWAMCGVPDVLHVDHGSDFISHHLEHATRDLHVRIIHSTVGRPQGRGKIERFFGTINTELLPTLPGHLAAGTEAVPTLRLPDLYAAVRSFIGSYNLRAHREVKASPHDAWIGDGWLPRLPDSLEALDSLLLTVPTSRIVQRDGVHFLGQRYLAPTLASFVGHAVTIRYDPRDVSEIRVFDHDTFICVAVDEDHPNLRPSLHDIDTASASEPHRWALSQIGKNARGALSKRHKARFEAHLADCPACTVIAADAVDTSRRFTSAVVPLAVAVLAATTLPAFLATRDPADPHTPHGDASAATSLRLTHRTRATVITTAAAVVALTGAAIGYTLTPTSPSRVELIIIDESERLSATALEMLRDLHDRTRVAVILIGMPGLDQRFRHYPQLFSRLGFAHNYQPLTTEELMFVLDRQWKRLGHELDPDDFTDHQAVAAIARITRGNFRLLERLFPQVARVLKINELDTITDDVIEAAASTLVIRMMQNNVTRTKQNCVISHRLPDPARSRVWAAPLRVVVFAAVRVVLAIAKSGCPREHLRSLDGRQVKPPTPGAPAFAIAGSEVSLHGGDRDLGSGSLPNAGVSADGVGARRVCHELR